MKIKKVGHAIKRFVISQWQLLAILVFAVCLFSSCFNNFFSGDDWFHLNIVQITSVQEFINFFNPDYTAQSAAFYRPLSTQVFFFVFYELFGLWALPYYVFIMALFLLSLLLLCQVVQKLHFSKQVALLTVLIFAMSHTNFTRLNFLSAGQEVFMSCFFLAALWSNLTNKQSFGTYLRTTLFYILALLSKDNAIVFPVVIIILDWVKDQKIVFSKIIMLAIVTAAYVFLRFIVFDTSAINIEAYKLNFSPSLIMNTFYFYTVWAIGGPELLQDYLASPIRLIDRYFSDFQMAGVLIIINLLLTVASLVSLVVANLRNASSKYLVPAILFVVTLSPVLFLPQHKFALEMSIPMMCFALGIAWLCEKKPRWLVATVIIFLLSLNINSIYLTNKTHYSVQRSTISKKVYDYFLSNYPTEPQDSYFLFRNSNTPGSELISWGSSKQVSYALWGSNFIQVFYHDRAIQTEYEDIDFQPPVDKQEIAIDSAKFL